VLTTATIAAWFECVGNVILSLLAKSGRVVADDGEELRAPLPDVLQQFPGAVSRSALG